MVYINNLSCYVNSAFNVFYFFFLQVCFRGQTSIDIVSAIKIVNV